MNERRFVPCTNPGEFAAILKARMRDHRRWQHRETERISAEVFDEVVEALANHTVEREQKSLSLPFAEPMNARRTQ
jgi:hypothetical protein